MEHAKRTENPFGFSSRGIQIAVDYFKAKGCTQIEVWLPRDRYGKSPKNFIFTKFLKTFLLHKFLPKIKVDKLYFHEKFYNYLRFSPRHQVGRCDNQMILNKLLEQNILQFSPSRRVRGHYENAYDDR